MRLLLARHAEIDTGGRYFGASDLPITKNGRRQARELAGRITPRHPDVCLCSPMLRTRQTADIIAGGIGCQTEYMDDLREIDFGLWEGMTYNEIVEKYPEQAAAWAASPLDFTFPGGDNTMIFFKRISRFARRLSQRSEETILLVTHGGVIRTLVCHFLGLGFDKHLLFNIRPAKLATLEIFTERGVLNGFNL